MRSSFPDKKAATPSHLNVAIRIATVAVHKVPVVTVLDDVLRDWQFGAFQLRINTLQSRCRGFVGEAQKLLRAGRMTGNRVGSSPTYHEGVSADDKGRNRERGVDPGARDVLVEHSRRPDLHKQQTSVIISVTASSTAPLT